MCGSTELLQPYGGPWHLHSHRKESGAFTAIGRNPVPSHSGVAQSMRIPTAPSQPVYLRLSRIAAPPWLAAQPRTTNTTNATTNTAPTFLAPLSRHCPPGLRRCILQPLPHGLDACTHTRAIGPKHVSHAAVLFFYCQHTGLYSFIHCWPFLAASKRQRRAWQRLAWRRRAYSASLRLVNSACVFSRPVPCSVLGR